MSNVTKFEHPEGIERPVSAALVGALENVIDDIASNKMTPIEVLGVLDLVAKRFYELNMTVFDIDV